MSGIAKSWVGLFVLAGVLLTSGLVAPEIPTDAAVSRDPSPTPVLAVETFATGLDQPVFVGSPPGDPDRILIVERETRRIIIFKNGVRLPKPYLNLADRAGATEPEQGVLGFAFHPDYPRRRQIYVNYTNKDGDTVIERFKVRKHLNKARRKKCKLILTIHQSAPNHNGGMLAFGPNKYLYIGTGDGGGAEDPLGHGQSLDSLLGKILRIDVRAPRDIPYRIPPSNPFVNDANARDEIWAYGLRNPWRFSFDRLMGDLFIGDVGQEAREEVDFQRSDSPGGENYGWNAAEGLACRGGAGTCGSDFGLVPPIYDYAHPGAGRAVTGGYVYRGSAIPALQGTYFFGDYMMGHIWTFRYDGTSISEFADRTAQMAPPDGFGYIASFGQDAAGELYVASYFTGTVFKIVPAD